MSVGCSCKIEYKVVVVGQRRGLSNFTKEALQSQILERKSQWFAKEMDKS